MNPDQTIQLGPASSKGYIPRHGPDRTRTGPTEFLGDPGRKKIRSGPVESGRARVVEFSLSPTKSADFGRVRSGPVGSGRARVVEFSYKPAD